VKNQKNNFQYKAVIYDCDGVMFDSFEANYSFYNRILSMMGKPPLDRADREMMRILHTFASKEVLRYIFPDDKNWSEAMGCAAAID
jgi:phosphoglycolate phosphatase